MNIGTELGLIVTLAENATGLIDLGKIVTDINTVATAVKDAPAIVANPAVHAAALKISADWGSFETDANGVLHAESFVTKFKDLEALPGDGITAEQDASTFIHSPELAAALATDTSAVKTAYQDLLSVFTLAKGFLGALGVKL